MKLFCYNIQLQINKSVVTFSDVMPNEKGTNHPDVKIQITMEFKNVAEAEIFKVGKQYTIDIK